MTLFKTILAQKGLKHQILLSFFFYFFQHTHTPTHKHPHPRTRTHIHTHTHTHTQLYTTITNKTSSPPLSSARC